MVESLDEGEVQGSCFIIIYSFGFKVKSYLHCMVESLDEGEGQRRFFIIIWSFGFKVKTYLHG